MISEKIEVDRSDIFTLIVNQTEVNEKCLVLVKSLRTNDMDTLNDIMKHEEWINGFIISLIGLGEITRKMHKKLTEDLYNELKNGLKDE